ncbi:thioesterase II family protein [Streptomyces sp. NPDC090022]|uniref:thioesterase II family protein n=1 Tax=Streptomyces sp. NPDC090022 TaxID=3365920 RepID=UPI0038077A60
MSYLVRHRPLPAPPLRLVCFPHAGGSASFFRSWSRPLDPSVELLAVQYPGRESRFAEPLVPAMDTLAAAVAAELLAEDPVPTVLFGHSMGAAVAYETLLLLEAAGTTHVRRLCVSGRRRDPAPRERIRDDEDVIASVTALGATNAAVWEDPDLRELLLPILRNDYHLIDSYRPRPDAPRLRAEVVALTGDRDPQVTPEEVERWREVTDGPFSAHVFEGDHFYLTPQVEQVVRVVSGP